MKAAVSIFSAILFIACISNAQQSAGFHSAPGIEVRVIKVPNIPLNISHATMRAEEGRNLYSLKFKIKNTGIVPLENMRLLVLAASADGSIKGGESLCQADVPAPGKERKYVIPLASKFPTSGDHAVLSFLRVTQVDGEQRSVGAHQVLGALTTNTDLAEDALVSNPTSPNLLCDRTFCVDCVELARDVCTKGVHSVTCALNTCSCSFTCN